MIIQDDGSVSYTNTLKSTPTQSTSMQQTFQYENQTNYVPFYTTNQIGEPIPFLT